MSYHIEINEYQRRLIMKALTSTDVNQFSQAPGSGDAFDTEAKEFVCLVQMFGSTSTIPPRGLKLFSASKCDPAHIADSPGAASERSGAGRRDLHRGEGKGQRPSLSTDAGWR